MNGGLLALTLAIDGEAMPKALVYPVLKHLHEGMQYGWDALADLIRPYLKGPSLQKTVQKITQGC